MIRDYISWALSTPTVVFAALAVGSLAAMALIEWVHDMRRR